MHQLSNKLITGLLLCLHCCCSLFAEEPVVGRKVDETTSQTLHFEARETAGIRRRSDVVSARLALPSPVSPKTKFRIVHNKKQIVGQLRPVKNQSGEITAIDIDFIDHFAPLEARKYELQFGPQVDPVDEPNTGFELRETEEAFHISNRGRIEWTVRKDLKGLLRFRRNPDVEYVHADSAGLVFRTRDGKSKGLADRKPTSVRVARSGPIACSLQFDFTGWPTGSDSKVDLEFVRTKSWVRANWTVERGRGIAGMGAEIRLALDGKEKMIDFGADDFVYTTVRAGDTAVLDAAPPGMRKTRWFVSRGQQDSMQQLVVAPPGHAASQVAGWAHVMDDSRCTAIAVGQFAKSTHDRIEVDGNGRLLMHREFNKPTDGKNHPKTKSLEFWIHFVGMPVHFGARTSPQAMRSPLQIRQTK